MPVLRGGRDIRGVTEALVIHVEPVAVTLHGRGDPRSIVGDVLNPGRPYVEGVLRRECSTRALLGQGHRRCEGQPHQERGDEGVGSRETPGHDIPPWECCADGLG